MTIKKSLGWIFVLLVVCESDGLLLPQPVARSMLDAWDYEVGVTLQEGERVAVLWRNRTRWTFDDVRVEVCVEREDAGPLDERGLNVSIGSGLMQGFMNRTVRLLEGGPQQRVYVPIGQTGRYFIMSMLELQLR